MTILPPAPPAPAPLRVLGALIDWSIVAIGGLMVVLVFTNVLFHAVNADIAFTTELSELLMVWVTFLGGAAASRRGGHMAITEFLDKLGPDARRIGDAVIQLVTLVILGLLFWYGLGIVDASWGNELTVLRVPMAIQYLPLPVGAAAMGVFTAWDLWQIAAGAPRAVRYGEA